MKKQIILLIISITSLIFISFYINARFNRNHSFSFTSNGSIFLTEKLDNKYDSDIIRVNNDFIYGTLIDLEYDSMLYSTAKIFKYNINTHKLDYYNISTNDRIIDMLEMNNHLYTISLSINDNDIISWTLQDLNLINDSIEILQSGIINSPFNYPKLLYVDKENFIAITLNISDDRKSESYTITLYNDKITVLAKETGKLFENDGLIMYDINNIHYNKNKLYYTVNLSDTEQQLIEHDIINNSKKILYTNKDKEYLLYNYKVVDKNQYIQLVKRELDNQTGVIAKSLFIKNNKTVKTQIGNIKTFDRLLSDDNILFHNSEGIWKLYSFENNKIISIEGIDFGVLPKYFVLDKNRILVQNIDDNNYYVICIN